VEGLDAYFISRWPIIVIFILCIGFNAEAWGKDRQQRAKAKAVADKVEKYAECKEPREGKSDLVKDDTRVKNDKSGEPVIEQKGEASFYGKGFHGKKTASGEIFNQHEKTAAHPTLPLGSEAEVTNLETGKSVELEITDRGPYVKGRDIDLSKKAAKEIGLNKEGVAPVKIEAKIPPKAEVKPGDIKCR
jgi:rare lipoprotein A (peptidoglycan hydrolase)